MRIIVCTKRDLAGAQILNDVLERLRGHTVMVLLSDKTRPVENGFAELAEMKFLERDLAVGTLFPLVDAIGGPGGKLATFNGAAARYGVPIKIIADVNDPAGEALVRDFAPDLILSARFSLIFKRHIFEIPRLGTYNVHPGALPRYAGLFAPFRCLMDGADRIGCTLHLVDDGIDTGPVIDIGYLPVKPERSLLWHVVNTYRPGVDAFYRMLDGICAGKMPEPWVQDRSQRIYGSLPDQTAFDKFRKMGFRLYDPVEYLKILQAFLPPGSTIPPSALAAGLVGADERTIG